MAYSCCWYWYFINDDVAGQLLKINWHVSYLVYLLFIPTLVFFIFFVPSSEKNGIHHENTTEDDGDIVNEVDDESARIKVLAYALLLFGYFSCVMVSMVKLATMYVENNIGTPNQASTVFAVLNFAQLIGGFSFGVVYKYLKSKILPLRILLSGISMLSMSVASSNVVMILLAIISGIAGGMSIPSIFTRISQLSITKTAPLNNALALVGSNMGSFISPYLASILGSSAAVAMSHAGVLLVVISVIVIMTFVFREKDIRKG
ncbi:MFS transporter [Enterococcus faecium]|uniref:MFS transporter n=1 Tax=Enterococcus faecium TaxID=1352 RepID=UPI000B65761C|nr:MFS transporter [Enterococcus faecium]OTN91555.1 hypothetical protein A5809_000920 [Enterococcus faecium]